MTDKTINKALLNQLTALLKGGQAHATFDDAVQGLPASLRGQVPSGLPYSAWQIVEHIRITQHDILCFSRNSNPNLTRSGKPKPGPYAAMSWPADYWPKSATPPSAAIWTATLRAIKADRAAFLKLLASATPEQLHTPFPWADNKQTLFREALLIADHTSYHTGELIVLRRLLGAWKA